jgi:tetratricopeptide (TPR) repeat protein
VLSRLGKPDDAVAAYDKAFALDKRLADAAYNAGVVLAHAGKQKEAVVRFDKALVADPKHVDAAYNAGQGYYDLKQFAKAAERWTAAQKITPDDFNTAKKLLQAYMALGKAAEAAKARDKVFALKKAATDPGLVKMKSFVFDQFDVGKHHIFVYEAFDTSGDLAYVYQFQVTEQDKPIGSVNLETSAVIREQGVPFILGMDKGDKHTTFGDKVWKTLPAYKDVKAIAIEKIKASF